MILIVGLGNPGKKYEKTRHNVGFMVIDTLDNLGASALNDKNIILFKPQTFMNKSGKAVKKLIASPRLVGLGPKNLIVIHDDIDLPLGTIRISQNVGSAGHKGVQSIIDELGTKNFNRIRIGIQPKIGKPQNVEKFVLEKFTKDEKKIIKKIIEKAAEMTKAEPSSI